MPSRNLVLHSSRILGSIVILGKACDLIDQHQQSMAAASPAKKSRQPEEAGGAAEEASPGEEGESGIAEEEEEGRKAENREAAFPAGSKVEDIVPAAAESSDFSRDDDRLCREMRTLHSKSSEMAASEQMFYKFSRTLHWWGIPNSLHHAYAYHSQISQIFIDIIVNISISVRSLFRVDCRGVNRIS